MSFYTRSISGTGRPWQSQYEKGSRGTPLEVKFFGVRGSTPCAAPENIRYGGNTACVVLSIADESPIILDLGTGLRRFGAQWGWNRFEGSALVSHLHWDHVQGLPFFRPMHRPDSRLDIYGPAAEGMTLEDAVNDFMSQPYFPVGIAELEGEFVFHDIAAESFQIGSATVRSVVVPHCGMTLGFRVEVDSKVVVYVSDHQEPVGSPTWVDPAVLELCDGADVLIHDGQYTPDEFALREDWGHCTPAYAVEVAGQAGVDQLVLFHHDPGHDDDYLDELTTAAKNEAGDRVGSVIAAHEGLVINL